MTNKKQRDKLYEDCLEKWGFDCQVDKCIAVLAELTMTLLRARLYRRSEARKLDICIEIADVTIMLEQMTLLYDAKELIPQIIEGKLMRLKRYVESGVRGNE